MAVKIRMRRAGAKNDTSYRVAACDSRCPRNGKSLELLGWYDPKQKGANYNLKLDRIDYWVSKGAQMSETVSSLVKKAKKAVK